MGEKSTKDLQAWTRSELLSLPVREFESAPTWYDSLLILNNRRKHESGWGMISVIGILRGTPIEQATCSADDLNWYIKPSHSKLLPQMRTDCIYPAGALHFWGRGLRFAVGWPTSSIDITVEAADD